MLEKSMLEKKGERDWKNKGGIVLGVCCFILQGYGAQAVGGKNEMCPTQRKKKPDIGRSWAAQGKHEGLGEICNIIISSHGTCGSRWNSHEMRASQGNIKILSANINSWKKHEEYLLSLKYDVMALQETRHSEETKMSAKTLCSIRGYTAPGIISAGAKSAAASALSEQGRYKRVAIPLKVGKEEFALHVVSMHSLPQST